MKQNFLKRDISLFGFRMTLQKSVFFILLCFSAFPGVSTVVAFLLGILAAYIIGNPYQEKSRKAVPWFLKASVIGLGFGMNAWDTLEVGKNNFLLTFLLVILGIILGLLIGKSLIIDKKISRLISTGTAICGGSAIAAISPILRADPRQVSISFGTIFLLNSVALLIFPVIGNFLGLSQNQFGIWSALAIHDTSSVVGAASVYGEESLQVATTVKLTRTLWILPVSIFFSFLSSARIKEIRIPYFIGLFVLAMFASSSFSGLQAVSPYIVLASKSGLSLTLFLIGTNLKFHSLIRSELKPLLQGGVLWIVISLLSLAMIIWTVD